MPRSQSATGSSPRVPGTAVCDDQRAGTVRFIPACAGNGSRSTSSAALPTVHPRVCGERPFRSCMIGRNVGSSPRVRGMGDQAADVPQALRFIPACAGNGWCCVVSRGDLLVHPRVCGERGKARVVTFQAPGSSPRVRGTGHPSRAAPTVLRFIPACAGNGGETTGAPRPGSVHPRVCGERVHPRELPRHVVGSSPRVRGTGASPRQPAGA